MRHYIITGTSGGIGESIAKKLIQKGNVLFCISRSENKALVELARQQEVQLSYYRFDLSQINEIHSLMNDIFNKVDTGKAESICLINNAGIVSPIKPIQKCEADEINYNIQVNLTAPIMMTAAFISRTENVKTDKRIINISSGAGKKPYYGWSNYCSAKAGLDLFTQCVGVEQKDKEYPVKIVSVAPGVVDTNMQAVIRSADKENFKDLDRFISMKEENRLLDPDQVAEQIHRLLAEEMENGSVLDIRDLLTN